MRYRALPVLGIVLAACCVVCPSGTAAAEPDHATATESTAGSRIAVVDGPAHDNEDLCGTPGAGDARLATAMSGGVATVTVIMSGCTPERVFHVSSYTLDQSALNISTTFGSSNPYSIPQQLFAHGSDIHVPGGYVNLGMSWTSAVALPRCGDYQQDLYEGEVVTVVGPDGHPGFRAGGIVLQDECEPAPTTPAATVPPMPPTTPATTTAPTSATTTPTATTPTAVSSTEPTPTSSTLPGIDPSASATSTPASAASTTPTAVATSAATPRTGASLAYTGSTATGLLLVVAAALVSIGVVALLISRALRPTPAGSHRAR